MKKLFLLVFIGISLQSQAQDQTIALDSAANDTLDYWHVYRNGSLILKANANSNDLVITITKGTLFNTDLFEIEYHGGQENLVGEYNHVSIENENGEYITSIEIQKNSKRHRIKTKELQKLAHQNGGDKLVFYYAPILAGGMRHKLFSVEIK